MAIQPGGLACFSLIFRRHFSVNGLVTALFVIRVGGLGIAFVMWLACLERRLTYGFTFAMKI